jgi:cyclic lactone autoinducer peptide
MVVFGMVLAVLSMVSACTFILGQPEFPQKADYNR